MTAPHPQRCIHTHVCKFARLGRDITKNSDYRCVVECNIRATTEREKVLDIVFATIEKESTLPNGKRTCIGSGTQLIERIKKELRRQGEPAQHDGEQG
jgi:phage-related baseplate assembly protein